MEPSRRLLLIESQRRPVGFAPVTLNGTLTPGPRLTNVLTSAPSQIWSLAVATDGVIWAGTGGDGRLIRIRPGQREETA